MNGFDREKWRAELLERFPILTTYCHESDVLALLERAYAEGRADGACEVIEMARRTAAARGTP